MLKVPGLCTVTVTRWNFGIMFCTPVSDCAYNFMRDQITIVITNSLYNYIITISIRIIDRIITSLKNGEGGVRGGGGRRAGEGEYNR